MSLRREEMKRFWDKVIKTNTCWNWSASLDGKGYGQFSFKGRNVRAHRMSYQLSKGHICEGSCILHKCDNRRCVKPSHLKEGSIADNNKDAQLKGRHRYIAHKAEAHGNSKLTTAKVKDIQERLNNNEKGKDIAKLYKVTPGLISAIKHGRLWRLL